MSESASTPLDTAQQASEQSLETMFAALKQWHNFKLEAGAGAGKTYSLIQALNRILAQRSTYLPRSDQRVACLTYTNVARDEIITRTDESPFVFADTLHGFLWEMISPYQKALAKALLASEAWTKILAEHPDIDGVEIDYDLGIRAFDDNKIALHHDDIPSLAIELFKMPKFRSLIADRFPVIFVDEYQDTPAGLAEAFLSGHGIDKVSPVIGFFGDHWQQIYARTCGSIDHPTVTSIPKNANFRSDRSIVNFLNCLRPELTQAPALDAAEGTVTVYHTNAWPGERLTGHWKGQISHEATRNCLTWLRTDSPSSVWARESDDLKVLMLTHATIANELGYSSLNDVFKYNDSFVRKEDPVIAYLIDVIEPVLEAFKSRRYGTLFAALGTKGPAIQAPSDKARWNNFLKKLATITAEGTVGDVLDLLQAEGPFALPTRVSKRERELREAVKQLPDGYPPTEPRRLVEHNALRTVPYKEVRALRTYLSESTVFSTKHAVKGAEFNDVIVVLGRGWNLYDFAQMLSTYPQRDSLNSQERARFERTRNLFYVAASRAKHNLALLFTQELDGKCLATLIEWVGAGNVVSIDFVDERTPAGD
ncbi:UvrD-helicase domain-containing protein [Mycolicibacterium sp. Y3]